MNSLLKNILFSVMAAIMLGLTGGINITKMQCSMGSKVFVGVENKNCHLQQSNSCTKAVTKSSCCMAKAKESKEKLPCKKETIEFIYDYNTVISDGHHVAHTHQLSKVIKCRVVQQTTLGAKRLSHAILRDKSPTLMRKPILSKIQSFLI